MAMNRNKATVYLNMALIISLLFLVTIAESRSILGGKVMKNADSTLTCETVVGVESGDTCFSITESHKLESEEFATINPNINCKALFVGQWVCVQGSAK